MRTTCDVTPRSADVPTGPDRPSGEIPDLPEPGELILYRRDFRHHAVFEAPHGKVADLRRLADGVDAPIWAGIGSAANKARYDFIAC
jgi:hypothetical protein